MEEYPLQIRDAVSLLKRMQTNSQEMSMWKNLRLAREVLRLLDSIPARGESHTPYDKIFLLDILCDNLSNRDLPRFTIGVLERMRELSELVREGDAAEYDSPLTGEDIAQELEKWRRYVDTAHVSDEEWVEEYGIHLKFDPVERTQLWEELYETVERQTDAEIGSDFPRGMGFCHIYWHTKTAVLAQHGIEWRSPACMNPGTLFD